MTFKSTLAIAGLLAGLVATTAIAHDYTHGDLHIDHPFARENPRVGGAGGAFMTITNHGDTDDRMISGATPASNVVELHTHIMDGGVMRMREIEGGIPVPAGETVLLQPGGLHVMLIDLVEPLVEGESIPLTLTFEHAGSIEVMVSIEDITAGADHGMTHDHDHDHEHGTDGEHDHHGSHGEHGAHTSD